MLFLVSSYSAGSAILDSIIPYTSILAKWMAFNGVFVPFWKPCVHLTRDGVSNFTCAFNASAPTLLLIRKNRTIIGGFLNQRIEGTVNTYCKIFRKIRQIFHASEKRILRILRRFFVIFNVMLHSQ